MRTLCWLANKMPHKPDRGSASIQLLLPCTMVVQGMAAPALFLSLSAQVACGYLRGQTFLQGKQVLQQDPLLTMHIGILHWFRRASQVVV